MIISRISSVSSVWRAVQLVGFRLSFALRKHYLENPHCLFPCWLVMSGWISIILGALWIFGASLIPPWSVGGRAHHCPFSPRKVFACFWWTFCVCSGSPDRAAVFVRDLASQHSADTAAPTRLFQAPASGVSSYTLVSGPSASSFSTISSRRPSSRTSETRSCFALPFRLLLAIFWIWLLSWLVHVSQDNNVWREPGLQAVGLELSRAAGLGHWIHWIGVWPLS